MPNFYLLLDCKNGNYFPLGLEPRSLIGAQRAKAWQQIGLGEFDTYYIATRIGPDKFKCVDSGKELTVENGVYIQEAWNQFLESYTE